MMGEEHDVPYFRTTLAKETARLSDLCKSWMEISSSSEIPEEVQGDIRTAVGLTELLMDQRFQQFSGLVDDCEFQRGEKKTTCEDLQGFWDMVYVEVEKVDKKFCDLEVLKSSNWVVKEVPVVPKKIPMKNKPVSVKQQIKATSNAKAYILAARKRLAEAKAMRANTVVSEDLSRTFEEIKENISLEKPLVEQKSPAKSFISKEAPTIVQSKKNNPAKLQNANSSPNNLQKGKVKSGTDKEKSSVGAKRRTAANKVAKDFIPLQCVTRAAAKRALMDRNHSI